MHTGNIVSMKYIWLCAKRLKARVHSGKQWSRADDVTETELTDVDCFRLTKFIDRKWALVETVLKMPVR